MILRWIYNFATLVSVILMVTLVWVWWWGGSHWGYVRIHEGHRCFACYPAPQALTIDTWVDPPDAGKGNMRAISLVSTDFSVGQMAAQINRDYARWKFLGIRYSTPPQVDRGRSLTVPDGLLLALLAILPILRLRALRSSPKKIRYNSAA